LEAPDVNLIFRDVGGFPPSRYEPRGDTLVANGVRFDLSFIGEGDWLDVTAFRTDPRRPGVPGWLTYPITRTDGELQVTVARNPDLPELIVTGPERDGIIDRSQLKTAEWRLADARASMQRAVNTFVEEQADKLAGSSVYTRFERDSFWLQVQEARALLAGQITPEQSMLVVPVANGKRVAYQVLAQKIIEKSTGMTKLAQAVIACRGVAEEGLAAARNEAEAALVMDAVKNTWAKALGGK
jgi:hypothetical protein